MRPLRLSLLYAALLTASALLPGFIALHLSSSMTITAQFQWLEDVEKRVLQRAETALKSTTDALRTLATNTLPACSPAHIDAMRVIVANSRLIAAVGYFDDAEVMQCTSWGLAETRILRRPSQFKTRDGVGVFVDMEPSIVQSAPRTALSLGHYSLLVDAKGLADVIVPRGTQIALASARAGVLATQNNPDPKLVQSLLDNPRRGITDRYAFSAREDDGFIAIAIEPRENGEDTLRRLRSLLMPLALLVSSGLITALIWAIRRGNSPRALLAAAVRQRAFSVHYQPMIHLATGACVGAEALVRWQHRDGSFVPPDQFIPLAESTGLISAITDQLMDRVIQDMRETLCADRGLHIAINLSADDIAGGDVLDKLRRKLARTGIAAPQIWLELTERGFVDIERARAMIIEAHDLGHSIAIDDFGTGYSSLQYLQSLPLDTLKIDKSFIDTIGKDTATSSVTPHIIDMARTLDLVCVAEGIETRAQCEYLEAQGVAFGQGWYFSRPLPARDFIAFCQARRAISGSAAQSFQRDAAGSWQPLSQTTPARSIEC